MLRLLSSILLILLLTACQRPVTRVSRAAIQADAATQAAHIVETELARPTRTATLPATQTPIPPSATAQVTSTANGDTPPAAATAAPATFRVIAQPGHELYTHPDLPDYVFEIDPALWQKDPSGETADLVHTANDGCRVESVPGHGLGAPERLFWEDLGRFRWEVMDYGGYAYVVPVYGSSLSGQSASFLNLIGYNRSTCRAAQEEILANLMSRREATGELSYLPVLSPTPRPALDGFSCPDTPLARLRTGDQVSVVTDGLWLRSEPRVDESTKIRQYLRNPPVMIHVIDGPVCDKYVYWQVEVSTFGEGSESIQGWLAEGDLEEYYIVPVK